MIINISKTTSTILNTDPLKSETTRVSLLPEKLSSQSLSKSRSHTTWSLAQLGRTMSSNLLDAASTPSARWGTESRRECFPPPEMESTRCTAPSSLSRCKSRRRVQCAVQLAALHEAAQYVGTAVTPCWGAWPRRPRSLNRRSRRRRSSASPSLTRAHTMHPFVSAPRAWRRGRTRRWSRRWGVAACRPRRRISCGSARHGMMVGRRPARSRSGGRRGLPEKGIFCTGWGMSERARTGSEEVCR